MEAVDSIQVADGVKINYTLDNLFALVEAYIADPDSHVGKEVEKNKRDTMRQFFRFVIGKQTSIVLLDMMTVAIMRKFRNFLKNPHCQYMRINRLNKKTKLPYGCPNDHKCEECKFYKPCMDSGIRKKMVNLNKFCVYLTHCHIINLNPVKGLKEELDEFERDSLIYKKKKEAIANDGRDAIDQEEFLAARAHAELNPDITWVPLAMNVAVDLGMRLKSMRMFTLPKMRWNSSLEVWQVHLTKNEIVDDVKTHGQDIPVAPEVHDYIVEFVNSRNERLKQAGKFHEKYADFVIVSERTGKPVSASWFSQSIHKHLAAVIPEEQMKSRKLCLHSFRKLFATNAVNVQEYTYDQVMKFLGHRNIATTQRYVKSNDTDLAKAFKEKCKTHNVVNSRLIDNKEQILEVEEHLSEFQAASKVVQLDNEIIQLLEQYISDPSAFNKIKDALMVLTERRDTVLNDLSIDKEKEYLDLLAAKDVELEAKDKELRLLKRVQLETANYGQYLEEAAKKAKMTQIDQMKARAFELRDEGLGYGKIAKIIFEEFGKQYNRSTIKYWLVGK